MGPDVFYKCAVACIPEIINRLHTSNDDTEVHCIKMIHVRLFNQKYLTLYITRNSTRTEYKEDIVKIQAILADINSEKYRESYLNEEAMP